MKQKNEMQYVKKRVKSGDFFKDGKEWFYGKYISNYKMKFDMIILITTIGIASIVFVFSSLFSVLSVSAKTGVVYLESDFEDEFFMTKIPKYYKNNEKNILRFVIESYVNYFESYDMNKFSIYKLNERIKTIRAKSSKNVGNKFESIVRNNYTNEVFAGITRKSKILLFEFVEDENIRKELISTIMPEKTPNKAKLEIVSTIFKDNGKVILKEEQRIIEIKYEYKPLERNKNGNFDDLNFIVTSYNYL